MDLTGALPDEVWEGLFGWLDTGRDFDAGVGDVDFDETTTQPPHTPDGDEVQIDDSGAVQGACSLEGLLRFFFSEPTIQNAKAWMRWAEVDVWLYNYATTFSHDQFLLALRWGPQCADYWLLWRRTLPRSRVVGVLAKWVNLCPALLGLAEPLEALEQHLRAEAGLQPDDLTLLLDVVCAQAKKTKTRAKKNGPATKTTRVAMTNSARKPNARQTITTEKRNQRAAEKRAASVGKRNKNEADEVDEDGNRSVLVRDFLAAHPHDIAVALTARHWAIFGPIPLLDLVGTSSCVEAEVPAIKQLGEESSQLRQAVTVTLASLARAKLKARVFKKWVKVAWKLRLLNNFEFMLDVMDALQSTHLEKAQPDWESAQHTRGVAPEYREALAQARPPCIPFLNLDNGGQVMGVQARTHQDRVAPCGQ
ncbi:uncharacterized protein ACA1_333170 [Acanthamoeba castellanii str. Neff]|uniref:Ras-GEF domain-containing protein n=1 Tax=Acanthamoeba castellanii (strain ATCC 30010 / Neff) TaxID=1257118 RepID=L8HGS6_ACACF|nr:uncharacterized protein ACA1_333170 [Acanthamoeba castellanii str. Neff]ELR24437.1 hypothetical protein ACA1_333170 [Acanthamoeba castellanii str. Neff]